MKSIFTIPLLLLAVHVAHAQNSGSIKMYSLQQCIDYARDNNPNLKNARAAVQSSQARVGEFLATGLPQINASGNLTDNYQIPTSFLPAQVFDPNAPAGEFIGVQFGTKYTGAASLNLDQMIFNGSYFVGLKASRTYTELARKDLVKSETDVVEAIKKAYYSVLVNKERVDLVNRNLQRIDSLLRQTRIQFENGFVEKIDVNRIQVQYNNLVNAQKNSALGLTMSYNLLKFQMGLPIQDMIGLSDNLETINSTVLDDSFRSGFQYSNRIEYNQLEVNRALVELDIRNVRSQYLPNIDFFANYGASYGTSTANDFLQFGSKWRSLGSFGLSANLPIFDGLRKSKVIQQKKSQLNQIDNTLDLTRRQIDMEQEQATLSFTNYIETLRVQRQNMDLSREVYDVSVIKYQQGVGSNLEVIDADAAYKEAQTNYFAALYDTLIASVDLEKAYGKLLPVSK